MVIEEKKVYGVDEEHRSFYFMPSESMFLTMIKIDSKPGHRNDWCALGKLLYCRDTRGRILWCEPDELDWKEVKGLEELQQSLFSSSSSSSSSSRQVRHTLNPCTTNVKSDIIRLSSNSDGNIVIFWNAHHEDPESLELWCAEISVERREGSDVWGKIEWSDVIFKLDPRSHSYSSSIKVLYSASVHV